MYKINQDDTRENLGKTLFDAILESDSETSELIEYMDLLIRNGADIDYKDFDTGYTILMLTIDKEFKKCFDEIISVKPNLEVFSELGVTAIHLASTKEDSYYLTRLCAENIDVDLPDKLGNRPINYAIKTGKIKNISILFKNNCTKNYLNKFGLSIYDEASLTGDKEVIKIVFEGDRKEENRLKKVLGRVIKRKKYSK